MASSREPKTHFALSWESSTATRLNSAPFIPAFRRNCGLDRVICAATAKQGAPDVCLGCGRNDGLIQRFEPAFRNHLAGRYAQIADIQRLVYTNDQPAAALAALSQRLPIDATIQYEIVKDIAQFRGRLDTLDLNYGQEIENVQNVEMVPPAEEVQAFTMRYGTYQFCKSQGLPMRPFKEAMQAVPN